MATPFELAGDLYYHTATNNALDALARQGELKDQRAFELLSQKNRAQLESRNRIGEIEAESTARGKLLASEALRQKKDALNQAVAEARTINPDYSPSPDKSDDQNIADAKRIGFSKTVSNLKSAADNVNVLWGQARGIVDAQGKAKPIDATRVNNLLLQDPTIGSWLDANEQQQLKDGKSPEVVAAGMYLKKNKERLLAAVQPIRQQLAQEQAGKNASELGLTLQELNSRASAAAESHGRIIQSLPADLQSEILSYSTKMGYQNPSTSSLFNKNGSLKSLAGDLDASPAAPPGNPAPPVVTDPNAAPPGTAPELDPQTYQSKADLIAHSISLKHEQDALGNETQQANAIRSMLLKGYTPRVSSPYNPYSPQMSTPEPASDIPISPERGKELASQLLKLNKSIESHKNNATSSQAQIFRLQSLLAPPPAPEPGPDQGQRWNVPGSIVSPTQPVAQPQVQQPTPTQPSAMNANPGNAMQLVAHQRRLEQVFGTSDPGKLMAARNLAKSQGATDDQLDQSALAAMNGDANAIAQARRLIAMAQGGNGQAWAPQAAYSPMSFGA